MPRLRFFLLIVLLLAAARLPAGERPWHIDDEQFAKDFETKLAALANENKCIAPAELHKQLENRNCKIALPRPKTKRLSPEHIYQLALKSVYVIGAVTPAKDDAKGSAKDSAKVGAKDGVKEDAKPWELSGSGTAFALTEDGLLMTNWHMFADIKDERYGVANHRGEVFPVIGVVASNPDLDVAVIRVAGRGFVPLALEPHANVASWVGVLSHPGGGFFTFTQGYVTRYEQTREQGKIKRWISITADYAVGSSGAPVLNRCGNVVGMATITAGIDAGDLPESAREHPAPAEKPRAKEGPSKPPSGGEGKKAVAGGEGGKEAEEPPASSLQMVVKLAISGETLVEFCDGPAAVEAKKP